MGNRLIVAISLGLALATAACGDDDGKNETKPDGATAPDGGPLPDSAVPGIDSGMDASSGPDGTIIGPDGNVIVPAEGGSGGDTSMPQPGTVTKVITSAGGKIASNDGALTLDFPPNLFTRPVTVSVRAVANPGTMYPGATGVVYEINPISEPFNQQAQQRRIAVTYKYRASDVGAGGPLALQVGLFEGGTWAEIAEARPYTDVTEVRGFIPKLGPVGLFTGTCSACVETCDPATCKFPKEGAGGVAGKCVSSGKGCGRCVPVCDTDNDGYCVGSPGSDQPGGDCLPNDPTVHPNAVEICGNGVDDDCDQYVDEGCTPCNAGSACPEGQLCRDGFCNPCGLDCNAGNCSFNVGEGLPQAPGVCFMRGATCNECMPSCDKDGDRYCPAGSPNQGQPQELDCDDTKPGVNPAIAEVCGNGLDDNCDGFIDNNCAECTSNAQCPVNTACVGGACVGCADTCTPENCRFPAGSPTGVPGRCQAFGNGCERCVPNCDGDGDGFCTQSQGDQPGGDCNDTNPNVYPGAPEICDDNVDNNCDSHFDEGCKACTTDDQCAGLEFCSRGVCSVCTTSFDPACRFGGSDTNPDAGVAGRRRDYGKGCSECVPTCDMDGDGFCMAGTRESNPRGGDCDDTDFNANPDAIEICGNAKDDDCDNAIDEFCVTCAESMMCGDVQACSSGR